MSVFSQAKAAIGPELMAIPGVVGYGGSEPDGVLRVYVEGSPGYDGIPGNVAGYDVQIIKVGHVRALPLLQSMLEPMPALAVARTERWRPAPGGVSVGHRDTTAGTLGMAISLGGRLYALTNNHVGANASSYQRPTAAIGDPWTQPGPYDGGTVENDQIAKLASFVPLDELGDNVVDIAVGAPIDEADLSTEILEVGVPSGFARAEVNDGVVKSGRTSGLNSGVVQDVAAALRVDYGAFSAMFVDQIVTSKMGDSGDSGSALVRSSDQAVCGILFAGSEFITVHNHIEPVLSALSYPPSLVGGSMLAQFLPIPLGLGLVWLFTR